VRRALLLVAIAAGRASAHVAPSVDDNGRFIKLTPLGDRVRLAYTVLFGERPGHGMRTSIDANGDGLVDEAEGQAFGAKLAAEVAATLDVEIDGKRYAVAWREVAVGMGAPQTGGGTFAVDLVGYLCLPTARGAHHVALRDRFALPHPGITEVKVEDSPGVTIAHARVGRADDPSYDYQLAGAGPLADDGLDLQFTAGDRAVIAKDGLCMLDEAPDGHGVLIAGIAVGIAVIGGIGIVLMRRRTV
jgi:hypothetical protein